ncbi:MAG: GNAT family N-acetyltransferase [Bacteroidota bacterium]|nr:GNAT family N-acetyltransferase [Bacteroidota bacterium]
MQLIEVRTSAENREFIDFPKRLYKGDPYWVCPLDSQVNATFDPGKNILFRQGAACRWILKDDSGTAVGRIAAFYDRVRSESYSQPTGGIGFFEVIDDRDAAFALFDAGKKWLRDHGMEAMDGPINFGENDTNWGLLVDGFMQQGYGMPYNKKYYRTLFEEYGFRNYFEQYSYHRMVRNSDGKIEEFPQRMMKIAEWLTKRPGYSFNHFEFRIRDKFIGDLVEIYNSAWAIFKEDFTPLDPGVLEESLRKAKPIIDEELIWFAYFNNKPVAFFILFPDFNQILKHLNGRLHLWNLFRFLYYRATHEMTRMRALAGGVTPSHQNTGVESAIFYHLYDVFRRKPWYNELELSWVGDFNPKMTAIYEALGAHRAKTHITFRYLMNRDKDFVRYSDEMARKKEPAAESDRDQ